MNPNDNTFGGQEPVSPTPPPQPITPDPVSAPEPSPTPEQPAPSNELTSPDQVPEDKKNSKAPTIIAIIAIVIIVIIAAVVFVLTSKPQTTEPEASQPESAQEEEQKEEEKVDVAAEYKNEELLKQDTYTIADINHGFSYQNLVFTGNDDVRLHQILDESIERDTPFSLYVKTGTDSEISVKVSYTDNSKNIQAISEECNQDEKCDHDYITGAKTLLTAVTKTSSVEYTFYTSTKGGKLLAYNSDIKNSLKLTETNLRSLFIKAAMTVSDIDSSNTKPYIFDMAVRLTYPMGKHPKSYKDINQINDGAVVLYGSKEVKKDTSYITVEQELYEKAVLKEVNADPKVDRFERNGHPYFRFYNGDSASDVYIYIDGKSKGESVKTYELAKQFVDKIGQ